MKNWLDTVLQWKLFRCASAFLSFLSAYTTGSEIEHYEKQGSFIGSKKHCWDNIFASGSVTLMTQLSYDDVI